MCLVVVVSLRGRNFYKYRVSSFVNRVCGMSVARFTKSYLRIT